MENTTRSRVAANVRQLRQEFGWSLAQLSERLSERGHPRSVGALSKMELGDRGISVDDLDALSDALSVPASLLLADNPDASQRHLFIALDMWMTSLRLAEDLEEQARSIRERAEALLRDEAEDDDARQFLEQEFSQMFCDPPTPETEQSFRRALSPKV